MLRLPEGTTKATGLWGGGGEGFCRSFGGRSYWRIFATFAPAKSHCSSVVEHFLGKEEVAGSIPANGSEGRFRGVAQPGSALRSGRRGPRFKSGRPDG
jgi:hypothetical protein